MIYTQLPKSYKYEVIAEAIYGREIEYFHYDFDRRNFEHLLSTLPDGDYKSNIEARLVDTVAQMANVRHICEALHAQIDDAAEYQKAVERVVAKREAKA